MLGSSKSVMICGGVLVCLLYIATFIIVTWVPRINPMRQCGDIDWNITMVPCDIRSYEFREFNASIDGRAYDGMKCSAVVSYIFRGDRVYTWSKTCYDIDGRDVYEQCIINYNTTMFQVMQTYICWLTYTPVYSSDWTQEVIVISFVGPLYDTYENCVMWHILPWTVTSGVVIVICIAIYR